MVALVGPSGCGKSTTLRMVNRLIEPTAGRIEIGGQDVTRVNPVKLRREIGYVIQRVGLFPHLTVAANIATVPQLLGWDRRRTSARVEEMLELVGLPASQYADRYPHELSGGQQQRVGVARGLAADPPVLLMDEPFGAVDPIARDRLQGEFRRIQAELGKTVLVVTHDIDEAVRLADRIAVFSQGGKLEQFADPATVLGAPANEFVADFAGSDRGLRRLAVTPVDAQDLAHPATVLVDDDVATARTAMAGAPEPYAVVLDRSGSLRGWVSLRHLGEGRAGEPTGSDATLVGELVRRFDETISVGDSLRKGLSEIVQHDAGWLPVLDGDRYVGVLTPDGVYSALRRTAPSPSVSAERDDVPA
ncbi:osmoprotectant transport system ATP-binding protein [Quadrisphaera granulorum]|uniref:ABC-type quaternary amine transporter n=2 Tax=Quadrisphaera granulorum TaxID=317664 RepID=A0A316A614_9ACTN|nr:osmoprotectant transport system ATP-binding protein [Quadrisphaera granulorum]SZE96975.1 osmoprotectant transport system ATP-binding protein [Quadrisphaera granulorum]